MKQSYIFLVSGFEEIEALATIDILRRGGVALQTVSLEDTLTVVGGHGVPVTADMLFAALDFSKAEMLILPGGTVKIDEHEGLKKVIPAHVAKGGKVAAICAAPMVLGGLGLLEGKRATCYPNFENYLKGAILHTQEAVVTDGNITTGRGPGLTFDFALELLALLKGKAAADEVAGQLLLA
ncbi:MAG: DJ-1/PfpI family protein [Bacteroidales bacterium]|nr:DJ-1/PfpI family protein [Bacteroidales bacterium]